MSFSRTPKRPITATLDRVQEALLIGDAFEAGRAAQQYVDSLPVEQRDKAQKSIKSSVKMRQPIRVGPYRSEEIKQSFLSWANENLNPKQVQEIEAIQRRYQETATTAGF